MTIARVGAAISNFATTSATTISLTISPVAGNTLVVFGTERNGTGALSSVTAVGGTASFTVLNSSTSTPVAHGDAIATNVGAGITSLTVTFSQSAPRIACVLQYSGVDDTTPMDVTSLISTASGTAGTSPSITPVTAGAVVLCGLGQCVNSGTVSPFKATTAGPTAVGGTQTGGGWTAEFDRWNQGSNTTSASLVIASNTYTTAGAYQPTWTMAGSGTMVTTSMVLRPAAGGGGVDASLSPPSRRINYGSLIQL